MDKNAAGEGAPDGRWVFKHDGEDALAADKQGADAPQSAASKDTNATTWTASEYIAHHKGPGWYVLAVLGAAVLAAGVYILARDVVSTVFIVILVAVFAIVAGRKPRVLTYRLDDSGLTIGSKFYPYGNFKSFALVQQGAFDSITFMPLKRFLPTLSVYFAPEDERKILDALSQHLPMEQSQGELVDRIMHRIRF